MHHFDYRNDDLYCEQVPLAKIAAEVGTPCYVYSYATIERHFRVFNEAFATARAGKAHIVCYSVKANSNLAILTAMAKWGAGADVVSAGELTRARRAGIPANKIVFAGVGKTEPEIELALREQILGFNVESLGELEAISRVASRIGLRAPIAMRVNPDVDAETHPYISTGLQKNKFGIPFSQARDAYRRARELPNLDVVGIDCHIGSQLTKVAPFGDAIARVATLARELQQDGVQLRYLDVGGGLGIPYREEEEPPAPADYARTILDAIAPFDDLNLTLLMEPGRVLVGNAGVLLTKALYLKQGEVKNFVVVDAGFNDLLRPTLYDSYHAIRAVQRRPASESFVADIVGPVCESGDFFARDRQLKRPEPGDVLALMSAGAYGFSMASTYNSRPRAAEVLVRGDRYAVIRRRETIEELMASEVVPELVA